MPSHSFCRPLFWVENFPAISGCYFLCRHRCIDGRPDLAGIGGILLPCETFAVTVCKVWYFRFGNVKILFDASLAVLAALISSCYFGDIRGIREGTLFSVFSTGFLEKCFTVYIPTWERRWGLIGK